MSERTTALHREIIDECSVCGTTQFVCTYAATIGGSDECPGLWNAPQRYCRDCAEEPLSQMLRAIQQQSQSLED